ncbi:hypothetical protein FRC08_003913 [Ceratobasidium sp. 394]|nr:hypothetical protein FRC08_003913 [Ceratobasidium sp. 394]
MSPFLSPFSQQIRSLAFDPTRHILAVGYGNTVALFTNENPGRQYHHSDWRSLELIKGPCNNESSLVHALLFYPSQKNTRNLLIGYAESGWNIWSDVGSMKRISPESNHNVCRIGRAALAADEKSLAVSTLDRAIAIYALGDDGPILTSMKEFPYEDSTDYSPVVPIASTSNGLTLGGTGCRELPVIRGTQDDMSLMRHEEGNHVIRTIATHGDKIVVGSTNWLESVVKCYSSSVIVPGKKDTGSPALVTVTEALAGWEDSDSQWRVVEEPKTDSKRFAVSKRTGIWAMLIVILMILILSADPPEGDSFEEAKRESHDTDLLKPSLKRHEYWVVFGVRHFVKYCVFQHAAWAKWIVSGIKYTDRQLLNIQ